MISPRFLSLSLVRLVAAASLGLSTTLVFAQAEDNQLLQNPTFEQKTAHWELEQIAPAKGEFDVSEEGPSGVSCAKIELIEPADEHWKMSFLQKGLNLKADKTYRISFMAKADRPRWVSVELKQHLEPYKGLGGKNDVAIGTTWGEVSLTLKPSADEPNARFSIGNLGVNPGAIWVTDFSMVEE